MTIIKLYANKYIKILILTCNTCNQNVIYRVFNNNFGFICIIDIIESLNIESVGLRSFPSILQMTMS